MYHWLWNDDRIPPHYRTCVVPTTSWPCLTIKATETFIRSNAELHLYCHIPGKPCSTVQIYAELNWPHHIIKRMIARAGRFCTKSPERWWGSTLRPELQLHCAAYGALFRAGDKDNPPHAYYWESFICYGRPRVTRNMKQYDDILQAKSEVCRTKDLTG